MKRARERKGKLFADLTFYVTPKVPVDAKLLRNVVTAGGGQVCAAGLAAINFSHVDEKHDI